MIFMALDVIVSNRKSGRHRTIFFSGVSQTGPMLQKAETEIA